MAFHTFGKEMHLNLSDIQDEVNRAFQRVWAAGARVNPFSENDWLPSVDVRDEPDRILIQAELPGVDLGAVDVTYADGMLTISGSKTDTGTEGAPAKKLVCERRYGSFSRSLPISHKIEPDRITASCRKGVLEVVLPKVKGAAGRTIRIEGQD